MAQKYFSFEELVTIMFIWIYLSVYLVHPVAISVKIIV